jgi:WD40 repeat protein
MASSAYRSSEHTMRQSDMDAYEEGSDDGVHEENGDEFPKTQSNHALDLKWCIGFNYKLVNGVINLENKSREQIFYVSGNTGVIYDYRDSKQVLLQGHCNEITCCAFCKNEDIIVTADRGPSSLMVVWNVKTGTPRNSIFDPHPNGVESLDITNDGRIIVTISREEKEGNKYPMQTVKVWEYKEQESNYVEVREEKIIAQKVELGLNDYQKFIHINKWKEEFEEFATTGEEKVLFWKVDLKNYELKYYQPPNSSISKKDKKDKKDNKGKEKPGVAGGKSFKDAKSKKGKDDEAKQSGPSRRLTQTVFIPPASGTQAVTGTDDGLLVVWDISLILEDMTEPDHRREIKTINLLNAASKNESDKVGVSVLMSCPKLLVIGATNGHVRFYDYQFRIVGWFEDDKIGEVTSISLSNHEDFNFEEVEIQLKNNSHEFKYPDFIVVDKNARIVKMKADLFNEIPNADEKLMSIQNNDNMNGDISTRPSKQMTQNKKLILESIPGKINSISVCPNAKYKIVAMSCENGSIYTWDYVKQEIKLTRIDEFHFMNIGNKPEKPTCLQFSPNGEHLIVATNQHNVYCYKVNDEKCQKNVLTISQKPNVKGLNITFSENSEYFAIMDDCSCVSLYKLEKAEPGDEAEQKQKLEKMRAGKNAKKETTSDWVFAGKLRSHMTDVNDVCFVESFYDKDVLKPMLYSIGDDKYLVEYDVEASTKKGLVHSDPIKIEHEVAPKACIYYPINNNRREPILMVATSDYKIKLWNVKSKVAEEKRCIATFLGPTYGGPIDKMLYLKRREEDSNKYVAYTTAEKIAGIIKLPLDGNPNKTMGMIAHPGKICSMSATNDGKFLFTCGADDIGIINMWLVNYAAIEEQERMYAAETSPLDIYPNLLEGGKDGQMFRDLKDFFYYAQIKSSSSNPTKAKNLNGKIPHTEVPFIMRALGYYPTKQEALNMVNEVLYSKKDLSFKIEETLMQDTFIKLFINHRPVYGLTSNLIKEKMSALMMTDPNTKQKKYTREQFIADMTTKGDKFSPEELKLFLNTLLAQGDLAEILESNISSEYMIEKILGMEVEEDEEEDKGEFITEAN